jgi:hypothetical protein
MDHRSVSAPQLVECDARAAIANPENEPLIAQALGDGLPVITRDPHFDAYGVEVLW